MSTCTNPSCMCGARPIEQSFANILGEMIANGLMNFHSTTHLWPSLVLLMVAWAYGWSWNWNWDKVHLLVRFLHMLGADWQQYKSQLEFEKHVLRPARMMQQFESHLHHVRLHLHESVWPDWDIMCTQMEEELRYLRDLHRKPLRIQDLARISIRKAVGRATFQVPSEATATPTEEEEVPACRHHETTSQKNIQSEPYLLWYIFRISPSTYLFSSPRSDFVYSVFLLRS